MSLKETCWGWLATKDQEPQDRWPLVPVEEVKQEGYQRRKFSQNSMWISWRQRTWVLEMKDGRWNENWNPGRSWSKRAPDLKGKEVDGESPYFICAFLTCSLSLSSPGDGANGSPVLQSWVPSKGWVSNFLPPKTPIFLNFTQGLELNKLFGDLGDSTHFIAIKMKISCWIKIYHQRGQEISHLDVSTVKSWCEFLRVL